MIALTQPEAPKIAIVEVVQEKKDYDDIKFFNTEAEAQDWVKSFGGLAILDQVSGTRYITIFVPKRGK